MKRVSLVVLFVCVAVLIGFAVQVHRQLPERVALHFDGRGIANGWMGKTSFTLSMLAVGLGIPALVLAITYAMRFFPSRFLNVPHPDYWRDPRNYRGACDFLFVSALWFASAFVIWQAFFSHLIVTANLVSPPHLDGGRVLLFTLPLMGFTFLWVLVLVFRFLLSQTK